MEEPKNGETITADNAEKVTTEKTENWLDKEIEEVKESAFDGERTPALILEENKIADIEVDFSKPFETWTNPDDGTIKKIVPVTFKDESLIWWLNVRNPVYGEIIQKGKEGQTKFKVLQTGTKQKTRYSLVE